MGESERRHRDSESHRHRERDDEYYSKRKSEKEDYDRERKKRKEDSERYHERSDRSKREHSLDDYYRKEKSQDYRKEKSREKSREASREASRDHSRDHSKEPSREHSRDHSKDDYRKEHSPRDKEKSSSRKHATDDYYRKESRSHSKDGHRSHRDEYYDEGHSRSSSRREESHRESRRESHREGEERYRDSHRGGEERHRDSHRGGEERDSRHRDRESRHRDERDSRRDVQHREERDSRRESKRDESGQSRDRHESSKQSKFSSDPPRSSSKPSKFDMPPPLTEAEIKDIKEKEELAIAELKQGSLEEAQREAEKLRLKMELEMKERQERKERLKQWAKEREATAAAEKQDDKEQKKWNLEDDDDDEEETPIAETKDLPEFNIPILPALSINDEAQKPKRTAVFGGKKVVGKKNAIKIGLGSIQPKIVPKILKPSQVELGDEDDEDEEPQLGHFGNFLKKKLELEAKDQKEEVDQVFQDDDGEDTLDSFMVDVHVEVEKRAEEDVVALAEQTKAQKPEEIAKILKDVPTDDEMDDEDSSGNPLDTNAVVINQADIFAAAAAKAATKKKDFGVIDHSKIDYEPFRKDFYKEPPELASMTKEELIQKRIDLDGIHVRGVNCPKPIEKWTQFGMPLGVLEVIKKVLKYEAPTPIQAQAIPAIMSGRDVIGIAKTGSGKTIAFILPMFRHIKDQRPSQGQEGPIGLVMTPTRELALQIYKDCKYFTKILGLRVACCYGGSPIKDQIADLKRGADIIICTPGRMIDLLCANGGRVTNLKRVSYLVLDEADRMFDMGFEPQVMKMMANIRPDRQTVLFSATFPKFMEALARKVLAKPLEIIVGARSVVPQGITQVVEIHKDDESKFLRLLGVLGKTSDEDPSAKFLIFVDRQESADNMMALLMKRGYPCLSLHGGKDQADRDSVISDFKNNTANILVATSVAARGLDVKDLKVVVNYDCPNHMEDYVHRCGRTGRAGTKGTAYTFIMPEQAPYSVEIARALTKSEVSIPSELQEMVEKQNEKVKMGHARIAGSGFGGRGLNRLEGDRDSIRRIQYVAHGGEDAPVLDEDEKGQEKGDDVATSSNNNKALVPLVLGASSADTNVDAPMSIKDRTAKLAAMAPQERARFLAQELARQGGPARVQTDAACWAEVEINDYPQKARWKVTSKEQISKISGSSNAAITSRGVYVAPGKQPPPGERKLYLFIEADFQHCVERAKQEIKEVLTDATMSAMEDRQTFGRYNVL